jgi:hypothetical protein
MMSDLCALTMLADLRDAARAAAIRNGTIQLI